MLVSLLSGTGVNLAPPFPYLRTSREIFFSRGDTAKSRSASRRTRGVFFDAESFFLEFVGSLLPAFSCRSQRVIASVASKIWRFFRPFCLLPAFHNASAGSGFRRFSSLAAEAMHSALLEAGSELPVSLLSSSRFSTATPKH